MKPRIFIGSSTEALDIAYTIQENLEYDAQATVWTQRTFELSSTALDSLLKLSDNVDFGIFVFNPEDTVKIRDNHFKVVRDNVIFEIGLFIGKLGKEKVFFVLPRNIDNLHLPSDLLGITSGTYDNTREDGNLVAALGPFCNQVRDRLQNFVVENILDLKNENKIVKQVALKKELYWEIKLTSELLKSRLIEINDDYLELEKGLIFQKAKYYSEEDFIPKIQGLMSDIVRLIAIFRKSFEEELIKSFGKPGQHGNVYEIKAVIEKIISVCKELLAWEYELQGIISPKGYENFVELMKGWTRVIVDEINKLPQLIDDSLSEESLAIGGVKHIGLVFNAPANMHKLEQLINQKGYK